jgi:hypothetical protein
MNVSGLQLMRAQVGPMQVGRIEELQRRSDGYLKLGLDAGTASLTLLGPAYPIRSDQTTSDHPCPTPIRIMCSP